MTSNGFTLADPNDRGMLDVVGFDTSVPGSYHGFCSRITNGSRTQRGNKAGGGENFRPLFNLEDG